MDVTADSSVPLGDDDNDDVTDFWAAADDDDVADLWADDEDDDLTDFWAHDDERADLWPWGLVDDDALASDTLWPRCPMLVLREEDIIFCAAAMVRRAEAAVPTLWLVVLGGDGWTLLAPVDFPGVPLDPDPALATAALTTFFTAITLPARRVDPDTSLVAVIYRPDGGGRGAPERVWTQSILTAATGAGLPVRAVVAAGDSRVRLLTARAVTQ